MSIEKPPDTSEQSTIDGRAERTATNAGFVKRIMLSYSCGKWSVEFDGPVTRRDVNRLRNKILVEYTRLKRESFRQKRVIERQELLKEQTNGQAAD